jgi:hypothetical protein
MTWSSRSISAPEASDPAFNVVNPDAAGNDQSPRNQGCAFFQHASADRRRRDAYYPTKDICMFHPRHKLKCAALAAAIVASASASQAQENKVHLFKVVTVKDEIVVGLSDDEMKALGGTDASAVAHALAQKGDMTVWQYNVHRGPNGDMQQAPTAKIGLLANASLRVEPYTTPYAIVPHQ